MFVFLIKDMNLLHHLISKVKCVLKQVANVFYTNNDNFFLSLTHLRLGSMIFQYV